ncbi:hypothetical protein BKK79_38490 (plasmid) [Cupriavidus sp. USMAA2-4]|jgi:hypothetical protein|uniref:hypothetical protein n=1 Tax=Cupriavidus sp. USMAA2-4 TaxID=876364 RepID=UPI0008A6FF1A|nr:hypothetical protein [Cupriavidus sp. USMAA2-4]AOY97800.1 hypothetical protein BKK79_38490 [Cupriavidus sp. USMAA2-4]
MTFWNAVAAGMAGNEASKKITGSSDVSAGRSAVAAGSGALLGAVAAETFVIGATALGATVSAPISVPLAAAAAAVAFVASLFD